MDELRSNLTYAWRHLLHHPGFTGLVVLTLALGIGANSAMFSVVSAVLMDALPYDEPDRLVALHHTYAKFDLQASVSVPGFVEYRRESDVFEELAAIHRERFDLSGGEGPERVSGAAVTAGYFQVFRIEPVLGRVIVPSEEELGGNRVVLLSEELWQRRYGGDPGILGRAMSVDGAPYEIIGVVPSDPGSDTELLVPLAFSPEQSDPRNWTREFLRVIGRLEPGVTLEQAQANMDVLASNVRASARARSSTFLDDSGWNVGVFSLREQTVGDVEGALWTLLGAVGFVFLIACTNVGNLFLARSLGREGELAVRMAIGASRGRVVRQLVSEGLVLSFLGAAAGLALAAGLNRALVGIGPGDLHRLEAVSLDGRVLAFTLGLSILGGMLFAVLPAVHASATDLRGALKEGNGPTSAGLRGRWLKDGLVVAEVALALILLAGSGLMIRSFQRILRVNPGFDTENAVSFRVSPLQARHPDDEHVRVFYDDLLGALGELPGVTAVAAINRLPLTRGNNTASFGIEGRGDGGDNNYLANTRYVAGDYFKATRIPLRRGRSFTSSDNADGEPVAIIDERAASRFWPGEDPLGSSVNFGSTPRRVVGIVGAIKHAGLEQDNAPHAYFPVGQVTPRDMAVLVRTANEPGALTARIRTVVQSIDPDQPLYGFQTFEQVLSSSLATPRFSVLLLATFAGFALVLAAVGIQGVLSQIVTQRRREIGIRIALGAGRTTVLGLVMRRGLGLTAVGLAVGLGGSLALTRTLSSMLFQVSATDPAVLAGVTAFLLAVSAAAAYLPARRATRVDPIRAIAAE